MRDLPLQFYERTSLEVAPDLLNKLLVAGNRSGRIVEVEAYAGEDDPGSHGWRGITPRTEVMFGPPGRWYVYLSYGVHWCANAVVGPAGTCAAVLLRAIEPLSGLDEMRRDRPRAKRDRDIANGPGKLTQAMGVGPALNGQVIAESAMRIVDDGVLPPAAPQRSRRIGLSEGRGEDRTWRWTP